jgi:two-component system nitrogen regulation sensor histidine kinase NtrY
VKKKALLISLLVVALVLANIGFYTNLRNYPEVNYYLLLLAINIDLIALIIVTAVVLRKLIKIYLGTRRNILRRKLANILFLYLFVPLLILNVVLTILIIQSTKSYIGSKTLALSNSSKEVYHHLYNLELEKIKTYKRIISTFLDNGLVEEIRSLEEVKSIVRVPQCEYEVAEGEFTYTLCIKTMVGNFKVELNKDIKLIQDISRFGQLAGEVRAFVKTRDIITGIYVFLIVFIALITLLGTVWLGMLVARHISKPIENLSEKAMRIAKGDLEVEVEELKTGDEIEKLSRAFKKMKDNLTEIYGRLKRERDLLERLLDALPVGVLYVSKEGKVIRSNRTFRENFTVDGNIEEFIGKLKESKNFKVEKIEGDEGEIYIVEDISSIVLAERFTTWQEAVKRIAHEIKNPLTPIRLNLERLKRYSEGEKIDREKFRDLIGVILRELERISELVNQFKTLSASKELNLQEVKLSTVIRDLKKLYSSAGIEITLEGDRKLLADSSMLKEMFLNLINNSIEWGADRITIRVEEERLDYTDNGKGIPPEKLEDIFIPYFSNNPKGMGLGMAVVKKIAEDHGWEIRALPSDKGAHFVIEFSPRKLRA